MLVGLLLAMLQSNIAEAKTHLRLATTTSTDNSGLLAVLIPPFEQREQCKVDIIAVGTGKALRLGAMGDVDVVLVHAPKLEEAFVQQGFGVNRRSVMYNDFVVIGPQHDPASLAGLADASKALRMIAQAGSTFVSRGDESGTHQKEKQLWESAGLTPQGSWYLEVGRGMGEVLMMADERQAYVLADRGTFVAFKDRTSLVLHVAGGNELNNPYSVIGVNPDVHPHVKAALADAFSDYLTSTEARGIITDFQRNGESLFFVSDSKGAQ